MRIALSQVDGQTGGRQKTETPVRKKRKCVVRETPYEGILPAAAGTHQRRKPVTTGGVIRRAQAEPLPRVSTFPFRRPFPVPRTLQWVTPGGPSGRRQSPAPSA